MPKKTRDKVIISCAITGGAHTPSMSDALPVTPAEIAEQSIDAAEAGAAIIHLHARVPETGAPTGDPAVYAQFLPVIKQRTDAVININLKEMTEQVLNTLTPREERVIKMRFGLEDGTEHTLEEVGQNFAVTRERIRQIEAKALRKLRHPSRSRRLRAFLDGTGRD